MKTMLKKGENFIIRGVKNKGVICPEYYEKIKWKCTTQTDRQSIFSRVEDFTNEDALVIFYLYLKRWNIEVYFKYLKEIFKIEKIKILNFRKLENILSLLVFASYFCIIIFTKF